MNKQFYYERKEAVAPKKEGDKPTFETFMDSFNVDNIIRTVGIADGKSIVLLNDIHERVEEVPTYNKARTTQTGTKNQRRTVQSEIELNAEDSDRLHKATAIVILSKSKRLH